MPFLAILKGLVDSVPCAVGAIIVDWEGESVQYQCDSELYDIRFVAAHLQIMMSRLHDTYNTKLPGAIEELAVTTDKLILLTGAINSEYFVVLLVDRRCPVGIASYCLKKTVALLKKEI